MPLQFSLEVSHVILINALRLMIDGMTTILQMTNGTMFSVILTDIVA